MRERAIDWVNRLSKSADAAAFSGRGVVAMQFEGDDMPTTLELSPDGSVLYLHTRLGRLDIDPLQQAAAFEFLLIQNSSERSVDGSVAAIDARQDELILSRSIARHEPVEFDQFVAVLGTFRARASELRRGLLAIQSLIRETAVMSEARPPPGLLLA